MEESAAPPVQKTDSVQPAASSATAVSMPTSAPTKLLPMKIILGIFLFLLLICLVGNYIQYQQTKILTMQKDSILEQKNSALQQNLKLNSQIQTIESKAQEYLALQGEICKGDAEKCLSADITRLQTKPILASASGGLCLVRNQSVSVPSSSDPDVGNGYAKVTKVGINTITALQQSCNEGDYAKLMQSYCAHNQDPVQFEVAAVNQFGAIESSSCSSFGCGYIGCPAK